MGLKLSRRSIVKAGLIGAAISASGLLGYLSWLKLLKADYGHIPCTIRGPDHALGHRLWTMDFAEPSDQHMFETVIIGGGIAGLSASRHLYKSGHRDFVLLEMGEQPGGNSIWGASSTSQYPWGAHYLPIPGEEQAYMFDFLQEAGIATKNGKGQIEFNEYYLCHAPSERLWINGKWQEGLIPKRGLSYDDQGQIDRFFALMDDYRLAKGKDGKYAFSIPTSTSSRDLQFTKLDQLTMAQYLKENGFNNRYLLWYINYCCRDDYGAGIDIVSAWAGIHYFASRRRLPSPGLEPESVLTWPEGNGFLVKKLIEPFAEKARFKQMVYKVTPEDNGRFKVWVFDVINNKTYTISCRHIICAVPQFITAKIIDSSLFTLFEPQSKTYAPWLVANITVDSIPPAPGIPVAWDNVSFYSPSLGFIRAKHQDVSPSPGNEIITYYRPLDNFRPQDSRQNALKQTPEQWRDFILEDLATFFPDPNIHVKNIDVWLWGHGMIVPTVGHLNDKEPIVHKDGLYFAHSDMSGLSIFEEAFWQGLQAASKIVGDK